MNRKTLGTVLVAATAALAAAEGGCKSAEEKRVEQDVKVAIARLNTIQENFKDVLEQVTLPDLEIKGRGFSTNFIDMSDPSKRAKLVCTDVDLEGMDYHSRILSCAREDFVHGGRPENSPLTIIDQVVRVHVIQQEDHTTLQRGSIADNFGEGSHLDVTVSRENEKCRVDWQTISLELCDRFFAAVKNALTGMVEGGRTTYARLRAERAEWETWNVPPFGTAKLPKVENPDAGTPTPGAPDGGQETKRIIIKPSKGCSLGTSH